VQPELEGGNDAEVTAAPADCPIEIRIFGSGRAHEVACRRDDIGADDIVDRVAERAAEPAESPAESEAAHAGGRIDAQWNGKAVGLSFMVHIPKQGAALNPGASLLGIYANAAHRGKVDRQPAIAQCASGDVVAAAAYRNEE
jgi:hypothetical protein